MRKHIFILFVFWFSFEISWGQKPWTFWYWMYGAVTKEGIKADLQAMKDAGLGGCYLMPIYGVDRHPEYEGKAQQLSPTFWEIVDYSFAVAEDLDLEMGVHVCDGFALAGGPWISPEESMQKVVFTDTIVSGGSTDVTLRQPETNNGFYKDIACFALPVENDDVLWYEEPAVTWSDTMERDEKGVFRSKESGWILYDFGATVKVQSLEINPGGNNIQSQRLRLSVSNDGLSFTEVLQLTPPRQGWQQLNYGFSYSIPTTKARYFRLEWSPLGSEPGGEDLDAAKWKPNLKIASIRFSSLPRLSQWEGKSGYVWRVSEENDNNTITNSDCFKKNDIRRVLMDGDRLTTRLPKGKWLVLRMGHTSTGLTNATAGGGKGLECDKFSQQAVEKQISNWFGEFMKRPHVRVVKYLHVDSWECGSQNWSENFAREFKERRGYNLVQVLPLMAGYPVESSTESEKVLRDVRKTINELISDVFFSTVKKYAHEEGCFLSTENVAPTMISDGLYHFQHADMPMGEFWLNSPTHDKPTDMLDAISGAHIYGKDIVQAEGFTEVRGVWDEAPSSIKPLLDRQFALGMNKLFFHVFTHNPWMDRKPGMTLDGIGLFFQRDQTWFPEAKNITDYITRCQRILQDRMPITDIAVFTGEEFPSRSLLPNQLIDIIPGIIGEKRVNAERERIANKDLLMVESPVGVTHSAGIVDLANWCNPLRGYKYDCINSDALLRLAYVEDGLIKLPGGSSYKVLVIPGKTVMNPSYRGLSELLKKQIEKFRKSGVIIIDSPFFDDDFSKVGLPRDIELPENMDYIHIPDELSCERYFITNQSKEQRMVTASFRIKKPDVVVIYDPLAKKYYKPDEVKANGDRTEVTWPMSGYGSVFAIFANSVSYSNLHSMHYADTMAIEGPWHIKFAETGKIIDRDRLFDWSKENDDAIKYYSGYAEYNTKFTLKSFTGKSTVLKLEGLHDVAHIYVNGHDCGTIWTSPYELDITDALKPGKNSLKLCVVNTWANALRGNDEGKAPFKNIWTNAKYRSKSPELTTSGLLGPVMLLKEK